METIQNLLFLNEIVFFHAYIFWLKRFANLYENTL